MAYTHRHTPPAGPVLVYASDQLGLWSKMLIIPKPPGTFLQHITGRHRNQKEHSGSRESGQATSTSCRMARCKIARCKLPYAGRFMLASVVHKFSCPAVWRHTSKLQEQDLNGIASTGFNTVPQNLPVSSLASTQPAWNLRQDLTKKAAVLEQEPSLGRPS